MASCKQIFFQCTQNFQHSVIKFLIYSFHFREQKNKPSKNHFWGCKNILDLFSMKFWFPLENVKINSRGGLKCQEENFFNKLFSFRLIHFEGYHNLCCFNRQTLKKKLKTLKSTSRWGGISWYVVSKGHF